MKNDKRYCGLKERFDNRRELIAWLEEIFSTKTCKEWLMVLKKNGVPCAPVNTLPNALSEEALLYRNMIISVDHEGEPVKLLGNPIKLSENKEKYKCPPRLGENTDEILRNILGYSDEKIQKLRSVKSVI